MIQIFFICFALLNASFVSGKETEQSWGYEGGTGPLHWGEMEQEHEKHLMCREGVHQSPVNIQNVLGYESKWLESHYYKTPIQIINNRHTIQLRYAPGSYLEWGNEVFELIQFHFHHPSEHRLSGIAYPMEIHLVHKTQDHEFIVIGVLVKTGQHNAHIEKIWKHIPTEIDRESVLENVFLNAQDFLPANQRYYHYVGSLTTPPCTENVTWIVMEQPVEISSEQLTRFRKFIDHNARPIQKLHHRIIVQQKD